jgi:hypothetical protein
MDLLIAGELKLGQWQEADLKTRPKGNSVKVALASRLRAGTTMTVGWTAEGLAMGTRGYLNHLLYRPEEAERRVNNIKNCPPYTVRLFMNVQVTSAPYVQRVCNPTAGNLCLPESEPSWLST